MLIQKPNPTGIDAPINQLQELLYDRLLKVWNKGRNSQDLIQWNSYARCYRNRAEDGYVAELYDGGNQYKEVYWDDSLDVVSFFGQSVDIASDMQLRNQIHLVFFANITRLKNTDDYRLDEEVRNDVLKVVGDGWYGMEVENVELSLDRCLREYPGSRREDRLKYVDMQPIHCFRINFKAAYDLGQKYC